MENCVPSARDFYWHHDRDIRRRPTLIASLRHPGLAPFARWLTEGRCPDISTLNVLAREHGLTLPDGSPLTFVAPRARLRALDYERAIAERWEIATRNGNLHDAFNALAWLRFPRTKAALNSLHVTAGDATTGNARNGARDAATLLDESGLLLTCGNAALVALLRARAWRELFWTRRDDVVRAIRPMVLGHGLAEKLMSPYRALTAHALIIDATTLLACEAPDEVALDAKAAATIAAPGFGPCMLTPLPVAALPGWDTENMGEGLFDDLSVFRPPVLR